MSKHCLDHTKFFYRLHHRGDVIAIHSPTVSNAVETGQIARRLGRRDQVVRGQSETKFGNREFHDLAARVSKDLDGPIDLRFDPDAQTIYVGSGGEPGNGLLSAVDLVAL